MTNVPGWPLEQVVDAGDSRPFPFPAHKKEGKGSGPPD